MNEKIFYRYIALKNESEIIISLLGETDKNLKNLILKIEGEHKKKKMNILTNNEFHFSFPYEFNDPFDSRIFIQYKGTRKEWKEFAKSIPNAEDGEILLEELANIKYKQSEIDKIFRYVSSNQYYNYTVCCFSELRNNILMWSHYANKHKGICLGFKGIEQAGEYYFDMEEGIDTSETTRAKLNTVKYQKGKPNIINPVKNINHTDESFYLTKSKSWQYENEYRILIKFNDFRNPQNHSEKRTFKFKKEILSEVIFGINTDGSDMRKIYDLVNKYYIKCGIDVKVYKAFKKKNSYEIDFEIYDVKNPIKYLYNTE
jgi:hypothetical protein